jgi:Na+-translocating ferredoxin:NAD+ oxidoreductase subunit D
MSTQATTQKRRITSPHTRKGNTVSQVMAMVLVALIPGIAALTWFFGWGYLINITLAVVTALISEAVVIKLRKRPISFYLKDLSAVVTAVLLALSLPAFVPWWVTVTGTFFAIVFVKQLYGGMGQNPFNPAMAAFALLIISFPLQMTTSSANPADMVSFSDTLNIIFTSAEPVDGMTSATVLDTYKTEIKISTAEVVTAKPIFGDFVAVGWEWVNLAFLLGGLLLLAKRIITWHAPVAMLASLAVFAIVFGLDADTTTPVSLHLLAGGTMLGAFFIVTDPVSGATSNLGKLYYGAGIGALLYIIRHWGNFPDAVAFAVLLMNFAAPLIDHYTKPRTRGHVKAHKGYK